MLSNSFKLGIKNNPLIYNLYSSDNNNYVIPGSPQFIGTEDGIKITTEDGQPLITEG